MRSFVDFQIEDRKTYDKNPCLSLSYKFMSFIVFMNVRESGTEMYELY